MSSNCGKNKDVEYELQARVSLMFSPRFDVFCDLLLTRLMATWNLLVLYCGEKGKGYIYIYTCLVPLDCSRIDLCYFTNCKSYFSSLLLLFFFILLTYSLSAKFFNAFCRKQNNRENFSKFAMTSYGKFYKEFFQMRHFLKSSRTLFLSVSRLFLFINSFR